METLKRLVNELPALTAAVLSALWLFGVIEPAQASGVVQIVGGLTGVVLSVLFRQSNDGPVTLWEKRKAGDS